MHLDNANARNDVNCNIRLNCAPKNSGGSIFRAGMLWEGEGRGMMDSLVYCYAQNFSSIGWPRTRAIAWLGSGNSCSWERSLYAMMPAHESVSLEASNIGVKSAPEISSHVKCHNICLLVCFNIYYLLRHSWFSCSWKSTGWLLCSSFTFYEWQNESWALDGCTCSSTQTWMLLLSCLLSLFVEMIVTHSQQHCDEEKEEEEAHLLDTTTTTTQSMIQFERDGQLRARKGFELFGVEMSPDTVAIALVYFVQGVLGLARLAVNFFLKDDLHLDPAEVGGWLLLPLIQAPRKKKKL